MKEDIANGWLSTEKQKGWLATDVRKGGRVRKNAVGKRSTLSRLVGDTFPTYINTKYI